MNQPLLFIKPHAMAHPGVVAWVEERLAQAGLTVRGRRELTGGEVASGGMVDRHYAANARAALCADPGQLPVDEPAQARFRERFGEEWHAAVRAGRVAGARVAQQRLGVTGEELNRRWAAAEMIKLAGGLYVARMPGTGGYLLNGFYPSIREVFTHPDARLLVLLAEFDPAALTWQRFRDEVIGATNPAAADPKSIRGALHRRQTEFGLTVTYRENVIHASASAFEALLEKPIWLPGWTAADEPLWRLLDGTWFSLGRLEAWRVANPLVCLDGRRAGLLDLLENLDTEPTAAVLRRLTDAMG